MRFTPEVGRYTCRKEEKARSLYESAMDLAIARVHRSTIRRDEEHAAVQTKIWIIPKHLYHTILLKATSNVTEAHDHVQLTVSGRKTDTTQTPIRLTSNCPSERW
jgi:hypothetical protein